MADKSLQPPEDAGVSLPPGESRDPIHPDECPSDRESDSDSDSEESIKSTRSFRSLMLRYVEENGRRYCNGSYFMPNDEAELTRLNIIHQIYLILLDGRLTTAPLTADAPRILDVGTGPGDWAIEMSAEYPRANIIASDLGVFDSGLGHLALPNVDFQLADAQCEWTYHEPFDLIHIRGLSGAFQDWQKIYHQAFTHLKPGAYLEVADADLAADTISLPCNDPESESQPSSLTTYTSALRAAAAQTGAPRDLLHLREEALTAAGFVDVRVLERTIPIGLWPDDFHEKTLGKMALIALLEGLEANALRPLTRHGDCSVEAARDLCEQVQTELLTADRLTAKIRIVTARKPVSHAQKKQEIMARAMARVKAIDKKAGNA
ncbi:hypothetical protein N7492_002801 [Penicillium capsulatum]|uniref:Methyltransferase n=1 Tax=Penicillium capsulatum TaxID=69766 RepID=A0A9W9LVI5_9EURO|nr:hypothetical protein N7492_002801 [Penicillium capsulatum]KAJ6122602.1 hypothetical protein N7512_005067 [Penicillium capsulatum]